MDRVAPHSGSNSRGGVENAVAAICSTAYSKIMSLDGGDQFDIQSVSGHAIIAGFGVPGRAVGEALAQQQIPFVVIELNPATIDRCTHRGIHMVEGDCRQDETLRRAGIERASFFIVSVPNDETTLEAVKLARELNP